MKRDVKRRNRAAIIISRLKELYPDAQITARHSNPFQLLVSTILSAQCTDKKVEKITPSLFKKYRSIRSFAKAEPSILGKEIYSIGLYNSKAKNIIAAARQIIKDYRGKVPKTMKGLVGLHGVGRKTANIVLAGAFSRSEGIAVDTHVARLSKRLRLTNNEHPHKIEKDLMSIIPKTEWLVFNYLLVAHGRGVCKARDPMCCQCIIRKQCPSNRCKR